MANFSEDGNKKTYKQLFCSAELTGGIHYQLICLSVLNSFLFVTASLGNTLILVALYKESSLHPPTKLLFRCLTTSDLCVGLVSEPLIVIYWLSLLSERWDICRCSLTLSFIIATTLCSVSLLTLTTISVDRLLALLLGLRYRHVVTLKRIRITLAVFWVLSISCSMVYFWNYVITLWYRYIGILLCLVISVFLYGKIFFSLRQHQSQVQAQVEGGQFNQSIPLNIARYRKAVSSALWLQLTVVVCYLPYGIANALTTQQGLSPSVFIVREATVTLLFLNSSLNPILYCWKIREVRQAVKDTIRHICCSSN